MHVPFEFEGEDIRERRLAAVCAVLFFVAPFRTSEAKAQVFVAPAGNPKVSVFGSMNATRSVAAPRQRRHG